MLVTCFRDHFLLTVMPHEIVTAYSAVVALSSQSLSIVFKNRTRIRRLFTAPVRCTKFQGYETADFYFFTAKKQAHIREPASSIILYGSLSKRLTYA